MVSCFKNVFRKGNKGFDYIMWQTQNSRNDISGIDDI